MVANSRSRTRNLVLFVMDNVTRERTCFDVSSVKQDRSVFVKFRSNSMISASEFVRRFIEALERHNLTYVQFEATKFRLAIDQFEKQRDT